MLVHRFLNFTLELCMESTSKPWNEDRVALLLGSFIFILAMLRFANLDLVGWAVKTGMWVHSPLLHTGRECLYSGQ